MTDKPRHGFAAMDKAKQRRIASMGGRAVAAEDRSFSQNRELASTAGRKGGKATPGHKRSYSQNRELAAACGAKGGAAVGTNRHRGFSDPEVARQAGLKRGEQRRQEAARRRQVTQDTSEKPETL
jgi:uncharacterized protein